MLNPALFMVLNSMALNQAFPFSRQLSCLGGLMCSKQPKGKKAAAMNHVARLFVWHLSFRAWSSQASGPGVWFYTGCIRMSRNHFDCSVHRRSNTITIKIKPCNKPRTNFSIGTHITAFLRTAYAHRFQSIFSNTEIMQVSRYIFSKRKLNLPSPLAAGILR